MGFFKELKEDITQAVNEIGDDAFDNIVKSNNNKTKDEFSTDELLEQEWNELEDEEDDKDDNIMDEHFEEEKPMAEFDNVDTDLLEQMFGNEKESYSEKNPPKQASQTLDILEDENIDNSSEITVITKGTTIRGGISSDCSLDVMGSINGDVDCLGKLTIIGTITGNSTASEIFVNTPRLDGDLVSRGSIKVGVGSVVVGTIKGFSAVIAGAVKGNIDINGPVIVDSTAIIQGDIKAKSLQLNNGAILEGACSLGYAEINLESFFNSEK